MDSSNNDQEILDEIIGWTPKSAGKFLSLKNSNDKIQLVKELFGVTDEEYKYDPTSTFMVDFNVGNAAFCADSRFNSEQTYFFCQSLAILLNDLITVAGESDIDFDKLRLDMAKKLHSLYVESGIEFDVHQIRKLLSFTLSTFLKPIRLILRQYQQPPYVLQLFQIKKIFQPPPPTPLSEFVEEIELPEDEFPTPAFIPDNCDEKQISDILKEYEEGMKEITGKRLEKLYNRIEELEKKLKEKEEESQNQPTED